MPRRARPAAAAVATPIPADEEIDFRAIIESAAVKDRVRRLMDRLGARRRAALAAHALRLGIA